MRHVRLLVAMVLALAVAVPVAHAQDRTGFAVHGGIGGSLIRDRDDAATFEGNDLGWLFGVEYRFVPRFALGVELFSLGSAEDNVGDIEVTIDAGGLDVFGRLIFPVAQAVEVYGLAGVILYDADVTPGTTIDIFGKDGTALGAGVDIGSGDLSFRVEGRYFDGTQEESGGLLTAGFSYRF